MYYVFLSTKLATFVDPAKEGLALPFLLHEDVGQGARFHFALLVPVGQGGAAINLLLQTLLDRLGFQSDGTLQPTAEAADAFLMKMGWPTGDPWKVFVSRYEEGSADAVPFKSFDDQTNPLSRYLGITLPQGPPPADGELVIPDALTATPEAVDLDAMFNAEGAPAPFPWLTHASVVPFSQFRFYLAVATDPGHCTPGFYLPMHARIAGSDEFPLPGLDGQVWWHEGPIGHVQINDAVADVAVGGTLNLNGSTSLQLQGQFPNLVLRFLHRVPDDEELIIPFVGRGATCVRLAEGEFTVLLEQAVAADIRPPSLVVSALRDRTFRLDTQFSLLTLLAKGSDIAFGPPAAATPPKPDVNMVYTLQGTGAAVPMPSRAVQQLAHAMYRGHPVFFEQALGITSDDWFAGRAHWIKPPNVYRRLPRRADIGAGDGDWQDTGVLRDSSFEGYEVKLDGLRQPGANPGRLLLAAAKAQIPVGSLQDVIVPAALSFQIEGLGSLDAVTYIHQNLETMLLGPPQTAGGGEKKRLYFYFDPASSPQYLDLGLVTLLVEEIPDHDDVTDAQHCHGYLDLQQRTFAVTLADPDHPGKPRLSLWLPGGAPDDRSPAGWSAWQKKRWGFDLASPPHPGFGSEDNVLLQIRPAGVSFYGTLRTEDNVVLNCTEEDPQLFHDIVVKPLAGDETGATSELWVIDNVIHSGQLFGTLTVPGFDNLTALLSVKVSQQPGPTSSSPPTPHVHGQAKLAPGSAKPVGGLAIGFLDFRVEVDSFKFDLDVDLAPHVGGFAGGLDWHVQCRASGWLIVRADVPVGDGLDALYGSETFRVSDVDLVALAHRKSTGSVSGNAALRLTAPTLSLSLLDIVGLQMSDLSLSWGDTSGVVYLQAGLATLQFRQWGRLSGGITAGDLTVAFTPGKGVHVASLHAAGLSLAVAGSFDFSAFVEWKHDPSGEPFFGMTGWLSVTSLGLPKISCAAAYRRLLIKANNRSVPALAVYASSALDSPLAAGIVAKEAGVGAGWNMQLGDLSRNPDVNEILAKIDELDPGNIDNWVPVSDGDFYLSLVGRLVLGSTVGGADVPNLYVLSLLLSIDTTGRVIAAAKMWLMSSVAFTEAKANANRPSLIGAATLDFRQPAIRGSVVTARDGVVEFMPPLQSILSHASAELDFTLTPLLTDVYLKKLQYSQSLFGVGFSLTADWRFSTFKETILYYADATATGQLSPPPLVDGPAGFSFGAQITLGLRYAGVITPGGAFAYTQLQFSVTVDCEAHIDVEMSTPVARCKLEGYKTRCWTDWQKWSKRFSKSVHASVLVTGELALLADAASLTLKDGLRARCHLDQNVCGHRVNISPSFTVNESIVDGVRDRVLAFENALDRAAAAAAAPGAVVRHRRRHLLRPAPGRSNATERWYFLTDAVSGKGVFLPAPETPWLTPGYVDDPAIKARFKFSDDRVTKITVNGGGQSVVILPPWDPYYWGEDILSPDGDPTNEYVDLVRRLLAVGSMMLDTAEYLGADGGLAPHTGESVANYRIVDDPRTNSTSRDYFRDQDKYNLPDGVYPSRFRPRSAPEFEDYEQRVNWQKHAGGVVAGFDRVQRARAGVTAAIIQELTESGTPDDGYFSLRYDNDKLKLSATVGPFIRSDVPPNPSLVVERGGNSIAIPATLTTVDSKTIQSRLQENILARVDRSQRLGRRIAAARPSAAVRTAGWHARQWQPG